MRLAGITHMASRFADFCYPPQCAACNRTLSDSERNLCAECGVELAGLEAAPFCDLCGMPLPQHVSPCPHCESKGVAHYERVIRLGVFQDPLKHLIHQMKYHRRWAIAEMLAHRL